MQVKRVGIGVVVSLVLSSTALAQESVVRDVRAHYGTPLGAQHGAFLVEVACATGKGLLRKDWGTFVRVADGTGVAQDILTERDGRHYDILIDGENRAIPAWDLVTDPPTVDPSRYYAPACSAPAPAPTPVPSDPIVEPAPAVLEVVEALVAALSDVERKWDAKFATLEELLRQLLTRPAPTYEVDVLGRRVLVRPK